jgi:hypothetical protein
MKAKVFDLEQRMLGETPICTCCNTTVAAGAKTVPIDGHKLHDDCGGKLTVIMAIKDELAPIIAELPKDLFKGSNILERMEKAYTVSGFKLALHAFCEHLAKGKNWLAEKFDRAVAMLKEVIGRSRLGTVLIPVMNF